MNNGDEKATAMADGRAAVVSLKRIEAMDKDSFLTWEEEEQSTKTDAATKLEGELQQKKDELQEKKGELEQLLDAEYDDVVFFDEGHAAKKDRG